jgi:hypothetical protein
MVIIMKPYGIPRNKDIECPDLDDISRYGFKSSVSRIKSKSGDIKNSFRKSSIKRRIRRVWKRKARNINKKECYESFILSLN